MNQNNLPTGFITVDEAVALIKSDSRENPVVDMDYMVSRLNWVETKHNFRIPKIKMFDAPKRTPNGTYVAFETIGEANIYIANDFERELVRKTIRDKFRDIVGHDYEKQLSRGISTVADDGSGKEAVTPRDNTPNAKVGEDITYNTGEITSNGENLNV